MPSTSAAPRAVPHNAPVLVPSLGSPSPDRANRLVRGDNLAVLQGLHDELRGQVRCIYMDPPYNNRDRFAHYADALSHPRWLAMMTERLRACLPLLRDDGSVWISIDDAEMHHLKVAADGVFGRDRFVTTIVWQQRTTRENRKVFSNDHEYLLVYAADPRRFAATRNPLPATAAMLSRYKNPDDDPRGPWQSISANAQAGHATPSQFYELTAPNGRRHAPPKGRCWVHSHERMAALVADGRVYFGRAGEGVPRIKRFLAEIAPTVTPETLWRAEDVGTNDHAKKQLNQLLPDEAVFATPKPEALLRRVLHIASDPGDLVLDPFLGSGTTTAVAHKLGRRWIGIESGEHLETHCRRRMLAVVEGEQTGISQQVGWTGGGGFSFWS